MKNFIALVLFLYSNLSFAETFVCSYVIDGKVFNESYQRAEPVFVKYVNGITDSQWEIVFENERAITLQATFAWNPDVPPVTFTILIDKVDKTFVRGGVRYKVPIDVSEGKCVVDD